MPRHADPAQRRRQVAEALLRVVEVEGLDAASIPRIARELGATTGLVQTYFGSKDELLLFAVRHLGELVNARVAAALAASDDLREQLFRGMTVLAGGDESEQDSEGRIWLAFLARAVYHQALRSLHVEGALEIRARCAYAFEVARERGLVDASISPAAEAASLQAFADGIALQRALEPELVTKAAARSMLRAYLDRIFL